MVLMTWLAMLYVAMLRRLEEAGMRVGALDDGMLPVNTAGSPGGGLQWPSGGDLVEWQLADWLLKVLMMVAFWWSGSWWIGCRRC